MFNRRETAAILAGLRCLQSVTTHWEHLEISPDKWEMILDVGTDCGEIEPLTLDEIDELCEKINVQPKKSPVTLVKVRGGRVVEEHETHFKE